MRFTPRPALIDRPRRNRGRSRLAWCIGAPRGRCNKDDALALSPLQVCGGRTSVVSEASPSSRPICGTASPQVLIVEDEVLPRILLAEELRGNGFIVLEAINAEEAWTIIQSAVLIDLLLTDIQMPGRLDGLELARRLSSSRPNLKVILLSALPPEGDMPANVADYFQKPFDLERMIQRIRKLMER